MHSISRRAFLKTGTSAAAATMAAPLLTGGWYALAEPQAPAYFEREFGVTEALCRKVLTQALAKGGDFADLYFEHTISNFLVLEDGKVNQAYSDIALGVGIRTAKGDQVGYGFTQELSEIPMLAAAAMAATIASGTARQPAARFAAQQVSSYYPLPIQLTSVPVESKLPLVQSVNDRCFALSPLVISVRAYFHDQQKRILVMTSEGARADDLQPRTYLTATVVAEKNGRRERASWDLGGRRPFSYYTPALVQELAKTATSRALLLFDAVPPPAGEMPVVLGAGISGVLLHEAVGHGMEADFNRKKISTFSTMLGKKVAEPFITIVDDGTVPSLVGSINFDDEGTPGERTVLVDRGVLTSYMHDKISARFYGVKPTGNGRRQSYQHYVIPRMRNTYLQAGPATPEDVIKAAGKGIYVQDVSNGSVKIGEGDFGFYVSHGRLIEDGRLGAPIKDVNIIGNGPKMLSNMVMVANDFEFSQGGATNCGKGGQITPCGFGQPTCLVKSLTVGGTRR